MATKLITLIWMPKNPLVKDRQPTSMTWKQDGKTETYYPDMEENGDWLIKVPSSLAGFTLSRAASNWKLYEPESFRYETRTGMGVFTQQIAHSVKKLEEKVETPLSKKVSSNKGKSKIDANLDRMALDDLMSDD